MNPPKLAVTCIFVLAIIGSTTLAAARDTLEWVRETDGSLAIRQQPLGSSPGARAASALASESRGTIQALPMPEPPGPGNFDRELAREREAVTRRQSAERTRLQQASEAAARAELARRAKEDAVEERRRVSRMKRTTGGERSKKHEQEGSTSTSKRRSK